MTVGIVGAGALGSNLGRAFGAAGIDTIISNKEGPDSLASLVAELGRSVRAGTAEDAAGAEIVVIAVRWTSVPEVLASLPDLRGRTVVDATNPVAFLDEDSPDRNDPNNPLAAYGIKAIDTGDRNSTAVFGDMVPGAHVVKAFNHIDAGTLTPEAAGGGTTILFFSGDDADSKAQVGRLIDQAGFDGIDLGPLDVGAPLTSLPFGVLSSRTFTRQ